jgi:thiol:disulfide interchange protein
MKKALQTLGLILLGPVIYLAWIGGSHVWADHWSNHVTMHNQQVLMDWAMKTEAALRQAGVVK